MKTLLATAAAVSLLALAGPVSAQMVQPVMQPGPGYQTYQTAPMQMQPTTIATTPTWMQDDGSSSDYPIHMPGDISGSRLNSQYINGINVPPGTGLPADEMR
jgi:hypothetical protein